MTEEVVTEEKNTDAETAEPTAEAKAMEERAGRMGWVPKDKFRGAADKWTDAATFVKNGEESLPILRERLRKAEQTATDALKTAGEFKRMSDENFNKGYARAKGELEARIETAAEVGGKDGAAAVREATKELTALEAEKVKREAVPDKDPVYDGWVAQNAWYSDPEMKLEAEAIAFKLRRRGEKLEGAEFLDKVKEEVKKAFPDKFTNPRRKDGGGGERPNGGGDGGDRSGKKGWEHLPPEAKEAGERHIKQKFFKDKAAYAESYWSQN